MTLAFDAHVAFDSPLYTFDGVSLASPDVTFINAQFDSITRATFGGYFRVQIDQATRASWNEG